MDFSSFRKTWAEVSLDAITHNVKAFKKHIGTKQTKLMTVVKADGYGHGSVEIAQAALEAGADYLAVAMLDEALVLRKAGIESPLLVLGYTGADGVQTAIENDIALTVFTKDVVIEIGKVAKEQKKQAKIHLKIETGMNRIGLYSTDEVQALINEIVSDYVQIEGAFTHFADADNVDPTYTKAQFDRFQSVMTDLERAGIEIPIKHCCNSAGTIQFPEMHLDMVRVGISLYGLYPSEHLRKEIHLLQAMRLKTKPVLIKTVASGEPISYGCTYTPKEEALVATIPIGYADGFSRLLSNRGEVVVKGKRAPIIGRICMDQSMIDITNIENVSLEDTFTIFGEPSEGDIYMGELADIIGTIHYEIACLIGRRVPRVYIEQEKIVGAKGLLT